MDQSRIAQLTEQARQLAQQGRQAEAEQAYADILYIAPNHVEALNFIAMRNLERSAHTQAIELLERAAQAAPDAAQTHRNLGLAYRAKGDFTKATQSLQRAVKLAPEAFLTWLYLGESLEKLEQPHAALRNYFQAIKLAQTQGRWRNDATTAPGLREMVKYAMRYVDQGRLQLFDESLQPLRARYGQDALHRVEECLMVYLGEKPAQYPDARQKPNFLFFPGLPSQTYFARELFPWLAELETQTAAIREELFDVLAQQDQLEPFLKFRSPSEAEHYLHGTQGTPAWDAFFFYRHGVRNDNNCQRCPHTAGVLETSPLVRIREHAPEILFSVLTPGSHILPHRGVTNARLVTHLPLIVPPDCALRVGGEEHVWQEGRCVVFDDTFEHEAWNRSAHTRVVLILDIWNPFLSEIERAAITDLVAAIGDFNRECEQV